MKYFEILESASIIDNSLSSFRTTPRERDGSLGERSGFRSVKSSLVLFVERPSARRGPGIESVDRNVRSKCRCSCVLQFTS